MMINIVITRSNRSLLLLGDVKCVDDMISMIC